MKNPETSEEEGKGPRVTTMNNTCKIPQIWSKTLEQHLSREAKYTKLQMQLLIWSSEKAIL